MAKQSSRDGRLLALIPILVGIVFAALLFPREVAPEDVPLPLFDERNVAATEHEDDARAIRAAATPLPGEVRTLGEAIRAFNVAEWKSAPVVAIPPLRAELDRSRQIALEKGLDEVIALRAAQLGQFLHELAAWEKTGQESEELGAVGGSFIHLMTAFGWTEKNRLAMSEHEVRVFFKLRWNEVARFESVPGLEPSLDEMREIYAFYILHPHVPDGSRKVLDAARKTARSQADCDALAAGERLAAEQWRLDKIDKLGRLDGSYPLGFARGVALYRLGRFPASAREFETWIRIHPNGPFTLRARNHLRAAIASREP